MYGMWPLMFYFVKQLMQGFSVRVEMRILKICLVLLPKDLLSHDGTYYAHITTYTTAEKRNMMHVLGLAIRTII